MRYNGQLSPHNLRSAREPIIYKILYFRAYIGSLSLSMCAYIYIYIYIERERERDEGTKSKDKKLYTYLFIDMDAFRNEVNESMDSYQ